MQTVNNNNNVSTQTLGSLCVETLLVVRLNSPIRLKCFSFRILQEHSRVTVLQESDFLSSVHPI